MQCGLKYRGRSWLVKRALPEILAAGSSSSTGTVSAADTDLSQRFVCAVEAIGGITNRENLVRLPDSSWNEVMGDCSALNEYRVQTGVVM